MMRPHCDRCDVLCDECQTWVEEGKLCAEVFVKHPDVYGPNAKTYVCTMPFGHDLSKEPHSDGSPTPAASHIWHIVIHAGGRVQCGEKMFCRACRIAILEAHVKGLSGDVKEG